MAAHKLAGDSSSLPSPPPPYFLVTLVNNCIEAKAL